MLAVLVVSSLDPRQATRRLPYADGRDNNDKTTTPTRSPSNPTPRSLPAPPGPSSSTSHPPPRAASAARQSSTQTTALRAQRRSPSPSKRACSSCTSTATTVYWLVLSTIPLCLPLTTHLRAIHASIRPSIIPRIPRIPSVSPPFPRIFTPSSLFVCSHPTPRLFVRPATQFRGCNIDLPVLPSAPSGYLDAVFLHPATSHWLPHNDAHAPQRAKMLFRLHKRI